MICHLIDVGQVAAALWRDVVRMPMKQRITKALGVPDEVAIGKWIAFWIAAHDIGKITPCFQDVGDHRTQKLKAKLETVGFDFGSGKEHHSETGTRILATAFAVGGDSWPKLDTGIATKVAVAVGGHHGTFPTNWDCKDDSLGGNAWKKTQQQMLTQLSGLFGVSELAIPAPPPNGDQSVWMYLAGLTSVADWIGSNVDFFPAFVDPEHPLTDTFDTEGYFRDSGKKSQAALHRLGWRHRKDVSDTPLSFENATGAATSCCSTARPR